MDRSQEQAAREGTSLSLSQLSDWNRKFKQSPSLPLAQLTLTKADPVKSLIRRDMVATDTMVFNNQLKGVGPRGEYPGPRTKQMNTGRCWMYAINHTIRYDLVKQFNLGDFQLSHTYLFFYDKLEKANWYLENILNNIHEAEDSRIMVALNANPLTDAAYWHMGIDLIAKYGIVPATVCAEAFSSGEPKAMNHLLDMKIREYAIKLRAKPDRALKDQFLAEVHTVLSIALGTPPAPDEAFRWEYEDKDGKYGVWEGTPLGFYAQYTKKKGSDPIDNVVLVNNPRPRNEYYQLYTIEGRGNVRGGRLAANVNVPVEDLEAAVIACIRNDEPAWAGVDVRQSHSRELGILDVDLFDLNAAYGFGFSSTKEERLRMRSTRMEHAMVITAVHLDENGRPVRYKLENSWGEEAGNKGWFMMTAKWFREHGLQVNVPRHLAEKTWLEVLDKGDPVKLPPWDIFGVMG